MQDVVKSLPVSTLAYIGDAYYELQIREMLLANHLTASGKLHILAIPYVRAEGQAAFLHNLQDKLTEVERNVVRRARNHRPHSMPKHADPVTYRYATAFEALIGYLHLSGQDQRITDLLKDLFVGDEDYEAKEQEKS